MDVITQVLSVINSVVWGLPMLVLILGVGIFLTVKLGFVQISKLRLGFALLWRGRESGANADGDIKPFNALMTSLSATIGTGNIAGVATAIFMGGPGALFWMWVTAFVGMATKFAEAVLAVHYREQDSNGQRLGGPMYYIKNGMGKRWHWLASLFALFASVAGFGIGNTVQANSVADALYASFHIPEWLTGVVLMVLVGLVIIGGVQRIAQVAGKVVPVMALLYLLACIGVLVMRAADILPAVHLILTTALTGSAVQGGFVGSAVWLAIRYGVSRGIFSNEAGLGSAPIAHACAQTREPVQQGLIAMLGTFLDTLVVCTMTGLAIIVTHAWTSGADGAVMTAQAFNIGLGAYGDDIVGVALAVFAFTTMIGWSLYSEKSLQFLLGDQSVKYFRFLWVAVIPVGAVLSLKVIWLTADTLNALMAIPNLIALVWLSPVIKRLVIKYFQS